MKLNKLISLSLIISSVLILSRCGKDVQVYNLDNHKIQDLEKTHPNTPYHISLKDIKMAIINSADNLGWSYTESQEKNILDFRQTIGDKLYAIKIPYDIKSYSVHYDKSINLHYNKDTNTINDSYNNKVQKLIKAIDEKIILIQTPTEQGK